MMKIVIEFSFSQQAFHFTEGLDEHIAKNHDGFSNGKSSDWIILGIRDSMEDAYRFVEPLKALRNERADRQKRSGEKKTDLEGT